MAIGLIIVVLVPISFGGFVEFVEPLGFVYLWNAIFLGLVVGFAEELIFRSWLWGEADLLLGSTWGWLVQAVVFSLTHVIALLETGSWTFSLTSIWGLFTLLFGLFLCFCAHAVGFIRLGRLFLRGCSGI